MSYGLREDESLGPSGWDGGFDRDRSGFVIV